MNASIRCNGESVENVPPALHLSQFALGQECNIHLLEGVLRQKTKIFLMTGTTYSQDLSMRHESNGGNGDHSLEDR